MMVGNEPPCDGCALSWRVNYARQPIIRCDEHGQEYAPDRTGCDPGKDYTLPTS